MTLYAYLVVVKRDGKRVIDVTYLSKALALSRAAHLCEYFIQHAQSGDDKQPAEQSNWVGIERIEIADWPAEGPS